MQTDLRVTKYNPQLRDSSGKHLKDEWTSYSDVGKYFDGVLFEIEQYYEVENKYINAIIAFFEANDIDNVKVENLEKFDLDDKIDDSMKEIFSKIENSSVIQLKSLQGLLKLILREYLWCELKSLDDGVKIKFGYDYYMYFYSKKGIESIMNKVCDIGLYVD